MGSNIDRDRIPRSYLWLLDRIDPTRLLVWQMHITIFWIFAIPPSLLFWKESVLWVILISLWANIASHSVGAVLQFLDGADPDGNLR